MGNRNTYCYISLLAALALVLSALSGCLKPDVSGGINTTEWDEQRSYAARQRKKQSLQGTELDPANFSEASSTGSPESRMSPQSAFGKDKPHLYVSRDSGPVTVMYGNVYHWVDGSGASVISAPGRTEQVAATMSGGVLGAGVIETGSMEQNAEADGAAVQDEVVQSVVVEDEMPMETIQDTAPVEVAASGTSVQPQETIVPQFHMDEVIMLVRTFEDSMRSRSPDNFRQVFTPRARFDYSMTVPGGKVMDETYNLEQYIETHRNNWRNKMDYDFRVTNIAVTVGKGGTSAVAEGRCFESLTSEGRKVTAEYLVTFEIEKTAAGLKATAMKAEGDLEAFRTGGL